MLAATSAILAHAGCPAPRRRARQLIAGALGLDAAALLGASDKALAPAEVARLHGLARRLAGGEPLSRILGRRAFWEIELHLSPDVFDPRPDSETVVEAVLARVEAQAAVHLLDLGTGSGCLLLALLSALPNAWGVGVDRSWGAAVTARTNARRLGLGRRSGFIVGDWGLALGNRFDVVVANPPYIATADLAKLPPEVRNYDPRAALDGGDDGLEAYRSIARQLPLLLAPGGLFVAEVGDGQAAPVAAIVAAVGLTISAIEPDLAGIARCVVARKSPD